MDKIMEIIQNIWSIGLVQFIVYLALAFLVAILAQVIVVGLLKLLKLDKKFDKWGINEGRVGTSLSLIGKLVFLVVFLLFLPPALNALGLSSVAGPLSGIASSIVSYLPNLLGAGILLYVGILLAMIIGQLLAVLLSKTKIDNIITRNENKKAVLLSDVIVKIVVSVIILITVVQALTVLNIDAISVPALQIINAIFSAVPSIILAAVVICVGLLVANIACGLLSNLLVAVNLDGIATKVLPSLKVSATKIAVNIVKTLILIFVVAQGVEVLGLAILSAIVASIVAYIPLVVKSAVIAAVAFIGASLLENLIVKSNEKAAGVAKIVKIAVYVLAGFMILSQLEIASAIIDTAFVVTLGAVAVAFALAFGLGGKDFAKKTLDKVDEKIEDEKAE